MGSDSADKLVRAACSGDLRTARRLLADEPGLGRANFYTACVTGEVEVVERELTRDPELARRTGGPEGWAPILYACFSRFLRGDAGRAAGIERIVRRLLERG